MGVWTPFASAVTETLTIPGGDGATITIRKVGYTGLRKARQTAQLAAMQTLDALDSVVAKMGGVEAIRAKAEAEHAAGIEADPLATHDAITLIEYGVSAWPGGLTPTRAALDELDPTFAEWLARAIWAISRPPTEAERKNASGDSTTPSTGTGSRRKPG